MVGFGFMDNMVMIQAGDLIDSTLGVTLGISTLTAAAFGQIFSDVSGVCFGGTVETAARKLGLPVTTVTPAQASLRSVKRFSLMAQVVGITMGCLLGMSSLLFMDLDKKDRLRRQAEMNTLFGTLMDDGNTLLNAERCTLFLTTPDGEHLCSKVYRGKMPPEHRLRSAFDSVDVAGDGLVSKDELMTLLAALGRTPEPEEVRLVWARAREAGGERHRNERWRVRWAWFCPS